MKKKILLLILFLLSQNVYGFETISHRGRNTSYDVQVGSATRPDGKLGGPGELTNTRASVSWYEDANGVFQQSAANTVTTEYRSGTLLGIRFEPQRTNLLLQSQEFDATWTTIRANIDDQAIASPDGTINADKLYMDNTAANTHVVQQTKAASNFTDNTVYTLSIFAKAAELNFLFITMQRKSGTWPSAYFNLANGTVGTTLNIVTSSITAYPDGWYLCSITFDVLSGATNPLVFSLELAENNNDRTIDGDGSSGVYLWQAQLEAGYAPTSPIVTTTESVTRAVDYLQWPAAGNFNDSQGMIFADVTIPLTGTNFTAVSGSSKIVSVSAVSFLFFIHLNDIPAAYDGVNTAQSPAGNLSIGTHKIFSRWNTNLNVLQSGYGGASGASTSYDGSFTPTGFLLGATTGARERFWIKNIRILSVDRGQAYAEAQTQ